MRIGSLFSGIGGLEMGLEQSGLGHTVWQVEQDAFALKILAKHWPQAERFEDVREVGSHNLAPVDVLCGGFPCQDISSAGKGEGLSGSRSGLWFEFARIIEELDPEWVIVENVASGAKRWVDQVTGHLDRLGYETLPIPISAKDVGAPHLRRRIFLVAHSNSEQLRKQSGRSSGPHGQGAPQFAEHGQDGPTYAGQTWPTVSPVCGVDDDVPDRTHRLKCLGNAVVPACADNPRTRQRWRERKMMIEFNTKLTLRCCDLGCDASKEVYGTVAIHPSVEVASVPDSLPVAEVRIAKVELDGWHQFADGDYRCPGCRQRWHERKR